MTRGQQIIEEVKRIITEAHKKGDNDPMADVVVTLSFTHGARWADRTMIEKACEWMDCYIDNYLFIDAENKAGIKWDDFINGFRKAMKGE